MKQSHPPEAYDPAAIEPKWQKKWAASKIFQAGNDRSTEHGVRSTENAENKKFYALIEFPYPSGEGLHVGHIRSNTAMDVISHKRRREGHNVLYPIGWDAFGLPTENYAIKTGIQPAVVTKKNTDTFRKQLQALGFSFDWSREINTTDPAYYKWTQWIFLKFLEHGLAYKKKMAINWCPKDLIGLANEEVVNGRCERCGTPVEKREKEQWILAITKYAERLLMDLDVKVLPNGDFFGLKENGDPYVVHMNTIGPGKVRPDKPFVEREAVSAFIEHWSEDKFIVLKWKKVDWMTPITGGIEKGQTAEEAVRAEIMQETGFKNLELVKQADKRMHSTFFHVPKDENRIGHFTCFHFKLKNGEQNPISEAEKDIHEITWVSRDKVREILSAQAQKIAWALVMNEPIGEETAIDFGLTLKGKKTKFLILHGFGGSATRNFVPWLKRELEKRGHQVEAPELPDTKIPTEEGQVGYVLKNCTLDENTVIIGHSLGGVVAMKALMRLGKPIGGMVLVAPAIDPLVRKGGGEKSFHKTFTWNYDFDLVKKLTDGKIAILSDLEEKHRIEYLKYLTTMLSARLVETMAANEHFTATTEPEILKAVMPSLTAIRPLLDWQERIKEGQRNWIGRSEGVVLRFKVNDVDMNFEMYDSIPQTFMAQTFTVIAPEHAELSKLIKGTETEKEVLDFVEALKVKKASEGFDHVKDMQGIFTGRYIEYTPTGKLLPIWVASYAVADYGTGIVNCSAHDERDFAFAKKYNIPLHPVLFPKDEALAEKVRKQEVFYREPDGVLSEPVEFKGQRWDKARQGIIDFIVKNGWGKRSTQFKLRDWVFSRQRYWGEPIPVIHCEKCGIVPVPEKNLPVELPPVENYKPTATGESPLAAISDWVNVKCPTCKGPAKRETDTMPNWAGSSWYYIAYCISKNLKSQTLISKQFSSVEVEGKIDYWLPVDWYNGGMEHTTLHLLYSRFWHKFLFDLGLVPTTEPYMKRTSHGLILAKGGEKMSKSKGNVVNPDDLIKAFGADALRVYEMFMGPFDQAIVWDSDSIVGPRRFIERVWKLVEKATGTSAPHGPVSAPAGAAPASRPPSQPPKAPLGVLLPVTPNSLSRGIHKTIKKVSDDIEAMRFNTAISALMIAVNEIEKQESISQADYEALIKLLAPFAPHVTEELWSMLGNKESIHTSPWPVYNPALIIDDEVTVIIQINGKARGSFMASATIGKDELEKRAREAPEARKWLEGREVKRIVVVPGRLVNIVTT